CFNYSGISFINETGLQLLHFEAGQWITVPASVDPDTNTICGTVTSLSPFIIVEEKAATTTSLVSNLNLSLFGQPVTFTTTVSSSEAIPVGTVTFKDNGNPIATLTLNSAGQAV